MRAGTRVSFHWDGPPNGAGQPTARSGTGTVITDEMDGKVLVACDPEPHDARHFVIQCTVTWLTVI